MFVLRFAGALFYRSPEQAGSGRSLGESPPLVGAVAEKKSPALRRALFRTLAVWLAIGCGFRWLATRLRLLRLERVCRPRVYQFPEPNNKENPYLDVTSEA